MSYLRSTIKGALPSSLLFALRDFKYLDTPEGYDQRAKALSIARSHYYPRKTIYFLPERPMPGFRRGGVAYQLCRLLGHRITTHDSHRYEKKPRHRYDVVFNYKRATFLTPLSSSQFGVEHVINGGCTDASKRAVNAAFEKVFGYSVGVDPTTYDGAIVVKSTLNATHDGAVVEGPFTPAEVQAEKVYQKVIDNTVPGQDLVLDHRVPVHGDQIPLVYLKYRPVESRFLNKSTRAVVREPTEVFSESEIEKILQLARHLGMDYGELDVLRDRRDERIYVVDANPTPWGPPRGMEEPDRKQALAQLAVSFDELIRKHSRR